MELVYLWIFIGSFVLLLLTAFLGELFDLGEFFSGEIGDIAEGIGEGDADLGSDLDYNTPSMISSRTLFAGLVLFGAAGFIAENQGASTIASVLIALIGMIGGTMGMYFGIVLPLARQQGGNSVSRKDWTGLESQVVSAIPANGLGKVSFITADRAVHTESAQSENGEAMTHGTIVLITQVGADRVIVERKPKTSNN